MLSFLFFSHDPATPAIYTLSLHDALPISLAARTSRVRIGFAVIEIALHHPVRLAIQLAVLDNLSRGRLEVGIGRGSRSEEHTSELQSHHDLVCRLLLEKKKQTTNDYLTRT